MRVLALALVAACHSSPAASPDALDKSAACASTFGSELTDSFGRLDGTLLAIVPPTNTTCPQPNSTHVTVQIMTDGAVYRMVVNVLSTSSEPNVFLGETDAPLAGTAWEEGWHPGVALDYVTTLGVTKSQFADSMQADAVARVMTDLELGTHISVYATSSGGTDASSAHLVHRNLTNQDGAIVLTPETAPHYLLTAFPEQTF